VPLRVKGHDPRLPVPGDGRYDWTGFLPPQQWPQTFDPPQGWFANWNNRPAANWLDSADGTRWAQFHRVAGVQLFFQRMLQQRGGHVSAGDVRQVMQQVATAELRASTFYRPFLTGIAQWAAASNVSLTGAESEAIARVNAWNGAAFYPDGASLDPNRVAVAKDPATTIWYHWVNHFQDALYRPWFAPVMSSYSLSAFRQMVDSPDQGADEFEDNYDPLMLRIMQGKSASLPTVVDYLNYPSGNYPASSYESSVMNASRQALDATINELQQTYGSNQSAWLDQSQIIHYSPLGSGFVPDMPFENKGTFVQIVDLSGASAPAQSGPSLPNTRGLPPLALGLGLTLLAVCFAGAACVARARAFPPP
jgi:penicillin amidase